MDYSERVKLANWRERREREEENRSKRLSKMLAEDPDGSTQTIALRCHVCWTQSELLKLVYSAFTREISILVCPECAKRPTTIFYEANVAL